VRSGYFNTVGAMISFYFLFAGILGPELLSYHKSTEDAF